MVNKFYNAFDSYSSRYFSAQNYIQTTSGIILGVMFLIVMAIPMVAMFLSPQIKFSVFELVSAIITVTVLGTLLWNMSENRVNKAPEKMQDINNSFAAQFDPVEVKKELLKLYEQKVEVTKQEILNNNPHKEELRDMLARVEEFKGRLSRTSVTQSNYSTYYELYKHVYFYNMFDNVRTFRNRNERHFEISTSDY